MILSDGGSEFGGHFSRGCEHHGIYLQIIPANSPHFNGKCERHGGIVKSALSRASLSSTPSSREEVELLLCEVVAGKNRTYHRGCQSHAGGFR
eukprot:3854237-Pyramimonas_sp.AAC.1